jgi:hypothetical protein
MYHLLVMKSESPTVTLVIAGSSPPKSSNTPANTGTRNATRAISTTSAKPPMSDGYTIADLTWRRSSSSFSSWSAMRRRVFSRMPPVSPAATIAT